jgi:cytochrome b subunit of formate dehydrogenase
MTFIRRFHPIHMLLHAFVALSFLGLVASGMPLKYSQAPWAEWLMRLFGGFRNAGLVHRACAVVTFGYFVSHLSYVVYDVAVVRRFRFNFLGPDSMVPNLKDLKDLYANLKWFLGMGPRPQMDRWTYWEKFDYWAVFWGVGMIGVSGLVLWFPVFFGRFLPGWAFNIATVIHSDEALLAAGFIFTIHFFNTHMRPEKFPMDTVIFTGKITQEEFRHERPLEYQRIVESNRLGDYETSPPTEAYLLASGLFGFTILGIGFVLLGLIIAGQFLY